MLRLISIFSFSFFFSAAAVAENPMMPDPTLSPERVIQIQLQALQQNDSKGIAQTWAFAHPMNKSAIGRLERFENMIKSPNYRMLLGHQKHMINSVLKTNNQALFAVKIYTTARKYVTYQWELLKINSGPTAGSWTTIGVSIPLEAKDAI